ncbi:unnamed protein product, partial [Symbiodinium necroappetens]
VFSRSPALLAMALRSYGNWLYKTGGTLHELRHAILAGQRQYIGLKPFSSLVWELVSRGEHLEPPAHRVPIPEPLLKALVALAWLTGHRDFAGVALLAFYGLGRIGEVLSTTRSDLLLPKEDLWDQGPHVFLRLRASKTATRGRGKVQHLKIDDEISLEQAPELLTVDPALRLTLGGLRGGGAVWCYRVGVGISDTQWRMRKHQSTLEYYLQEVGAITALNARGDVASRKMRAASATFPFVVAGAANQPPSAANRAYGRAGLWPSPFGCSSPLPCRLAMEQWWNYIMGSLGAADPRGVRLDGQLAFGYGRSSLLPYDFEFPF